MTRGGNRSKDSSFGLVGLASIGPIITMVIMILINSSGFAPYEVKPAPLPDMNLAVDFGYIGQRLLGSLLPASDFSTLGSMIEVAMALAPILVIFFVYELIFIKLSLNKVLSLLIGFLVSFVGLSMFLTAVGSTMSPIGLKVGQQLAKEQDWIIILIAFIIGCVTILCEPAVHVLTTQIEDMSDGQLKKETVLATLSIGVGVAICLSVIRTLIGFSIMYYIIPGYLLSLIMMFIVPDLYTAIAFDSGGTASGPMAVSFVLPLIVGIFSERSGLTTGVEFYESAFGVVSMVAMTPILAIQILGLASKFKTMYALHIVKNQIHDVRNNEIIHFN